MNSIQRILVEKAGHDNGFENSLSQTDGSILLSSARHLTKLSVQDSEKNWLVSVLASHLLAELNRSFPSMQLKANTFVVPKHPAIALSLFVQRAASLSKSLPDHPVKQFQKEADKAISQLGIKGNTEVERMVKQRIGQQSYREALMAYWGNACAVTGISVPEVLRASHAKPWADCATDEERLDVYNGFLLSANLDALFDRFLISFDDNGKIIISDKIDELQRERLGLTEHLYLRWVDERHSVYLHWHRQVFEQGL